MTLTELANSLGTTIFVLYEFAPDHFPYPEFAPSDNVSADDATAITEAWQQADCYN